MAEEHRFESQEGHRLCANNCGFFGSPATLNLCSKCYRDHRLKEEQASSVKIALSAHHISIPAVDDRRGNGLIVLADAAASDLPIDHQDSSASASASTQTNRCSSCRKRVGLTGFRCRCGVTFCSMHRYPEKHGCTFDFKAVGREAIAKANPVVKGEKLQRI